MQVASDNGWDQWKNLVLTNQKEMKVRQEKTTAELTNLRLDFEKFCSGMRVKAGVWGALAGLIPTVGILLIILLKG